MTLMCHHVFALQQFPFVRFAVSFTHRFRHLIQSYTVIQFLLYFVIPLFQFKLRLEGFWDI